MDRACRCRDFLKRVGADTRAKYVWFRCAEGYSTSIDMATALHPQTQMTFKFDGEILPRKYGFPMKVRIPTKLGFKNPKHVMEMAVINNWNPGYWEEQGYNWFSGAEARTPPDCLSPRLCGLISVISRAPRWKVR